jgi:chromosome segregation ATPase
MRDRYGREILAATETIQNQKSTIDAMIEYRGVDREKILAIKASVDERDEMIVKLEAEVQRLQGFIQGHEQTIADGTKIIAELREQSIRSTEHNNSLRHENTELYRQLDVLRKAFRELELNVETRGGQVPDLNTAWHMTDKPLDVKQKYLLDDTPLDDDGSGVVDLKPYAE